MSSPKHHLEESSICSCNLNKFVVKAVHLLVEAHIEWLLYVRRCIQYPFENDKSIEFLITITMLEYHSVSKVLEW